jgi:thiol-disulfide isomerase/thioredoxin
MISRFVLCAVLLSAPASAGEVRWLGTLKEAKAAAAKSGKPILADFSAVWCYSCYYMERNVLSKPLFAEAAKGLVLLKLDVDQEEGLALKQSHKVSFLPSFLLLDSAGGEIGRVVGEQTEADFLAQLKQLTGDPGPAERLKSLLESGRWEEARHLRDSTKEVNPKWDLLSARLDLRLARDESRAQKAMAALLAREKTCALAYDVDRAAELIKSRESLNMEKAALEEIAARQVFGKPEERCADMRSAIQSLGSLYARLGLEKESRELLNKAVALFSGLSREAGVGADRNLDDNLRVFLEAADRDAELDRYYPELMAAYPADYVYAYRYAKRLHAKKRDADALPFAEKAWALSYGANRSQTEALRSEVRKALGK